MYGLTESATAVLGCRDCPRDRGPFVVNKDNVQCPACEVAWPLGAQGSINSLINPAESVLREIDGMCHENPGCYPTRESLMFQKVDHVSRFEDRIVSTATSAKNYYLSTDFNFPKLYEQLEHPACCQLQQQLPLPSISLHACKGCSWISHHRYQGIDRPYDHLPCPCNTLQCIQKHGHGDP